MEQLFFRTNFQSVKVILFIRGNMEALNGRGNGDVLYGIAVPGHL